MPFDRLRRRHARLRFYAVLSLAVSVVGLFFPAGRPFCLLFAGGALSYALLWPVGSGRLEEVGERLARTLFWLAVKALAGTAYLTLFAARGALKRTFGKRAEEAAESYWQESGDRPITL